jgi:hypothetical protein
MAPNRREVAVHGALLAIGSSDEGSPFRSLPRGGGGMLKALFVMIVLSNDVAARLVERFRRLPV